MKKWSKDSKYVLGTTVNRMGNAYKRACKRAGIRDDSPDDETKTAIHCMRVSVNTWYAERLPEAFGAQLLGHRPRSTNQIYQDISIDKLREKMKEMPRLLDEDAC